MENHTINFRKKPEEKTTIKGIPRKKELPDVLKIFSFIVTIIGILAWIAGAAFESGYWGASGLGHGLTLNSIQQTALIGFINPIKIWFYALGALVLIGITTIAFGIKYKKQSYSTITTKEKKLLTGIRSKIGYDESMGRIGLAIVFTAYSSFLCVFIMLLWIVGANLEGKKHFKNELCMLREGKGPYTEIIEEYGRHLTGRIIDRTENEALLLDQKQLHFLNMKEKVRLKYSFNLPHVDCK